MRGVSSFASGGLFSPWNLLLLVVLVAVRVLVGSALLDVQATVIFPRHLTLAPQLVEERLVHADPQRPAPATLHHSAPVPATLLVVVIHGLR